jgi:hypothetical protein
MELAVEGDGIVSAGFEAAFDRTVSVEEIHPGIPGPEIVAGGMLKEAPMGSSVEAGFAVGRERCEGVAIPHPRASSKPARSGSLFHCIIIFSLDPRFGTHK